MFDKLKKLFGKKDDCKPFIIHKCLLCKEDIKIKHLYKTKCCGRIYDKYCYKKWKRIFGMKPCCFD